MTPTLRCPHVYGSYAEWSIRAVRAGKHFLCEKPLAANAIEARAMFRAAQEHGMHLVEGFPYRAPRR
jgi:predicted dehydrogenase